MRMLQKIATAFPLMFSLLFLMTCAANAEQYVGGSPTEAVYIAWTSDGSGHLQGQLQTVSISSENSTTTTRNNAAFTGTRNGADVSLVFSGIFGSGQTWTGNVEWRSLRLELPTNQEITLTSGSFTEFQQHVAALQRSVNLASVRKNAAQAVQESAREIDNAKQSISKAVSALNAMFPMPTPSPDDDNTFSYKYGVAWEKMQSDWEKESEDATVTPFTCYQKSQVQYDASVVSYGLSQVQYIDSTFSNFSEAADRYITNVRHGIATMRSIYPTYKAQYRAYRDIIHGDQDSLFTLGSIDRIEHSLEPLMQRFTSRLSAARTMKEDFDQKAIKLNGKAKAFPDSLGCKS